MSLRDNNRRLRQLKITFGSRLDLLAATLSANRANWTGSNIKFADIVDVIDLHAQNEYAAQLKSLERPMVGFRVHDTGYVEKLSEMNPDLSPEVKKFTAQQRAFIAAKKITRTILRDTSGVAPSIARQNILRMIGRTTDQYIREQPPGYPTVRGLTRLLAQHKLG